MIGFLAWAGVCVCGAAGAYARLRVGEIIAARRPGSFPAGTFWVNLSGGFVLGVLTGVQLAGDGLLVFGTGLVGAYTTFSTWMVESQRLAEDADWLRMWLYLLGSMVAGLGTTGLGWVVGAALT